MSIKFSKYLKAKWLEMEKDSPKRINQSKYARYLGVSQSTLSVWLEGVDPESAGIAKVAKKFGPEIYGILGVKPTVIPYTEFLGFVEEITEGLSEKELDDLKKVILLKIKGRADDTNGSEEHIP
jgi:transcriptional regulator with XRE-family HTH domain